MNSSGVGEEKEEEGSREVRRGQGELLFDLHLDRWVGGGQVKKNSLGRGVSGGPRASTQEAQLGPRTKADMGVTGDRLWKQPCRPGTQ